MMNLTLLVAALALGAPALKDPPKKQASILGEWVADQCTVGGKPIPLDGTAIGWTFSADGAVALVNNGRTLDTHHFLADTKASPATVDLNSQKAQECYLCTFKVEGDTLTLNVGWIGAGRPTAFECPAGSKCTLYVLKRVKKD